MARTSGYNLKLFRLVTAIGQLDRVIDNDPTIADEVVEFYEAAEALEHAVYDSPQGSPLRKLVFNHNLLFAEHDLR